MAKVLTVSCKYCFCPTRVFSNGTKVPCVWCKEENDNSSFKVRTSDRCEKCADKVGDKLCKRCSSPSGYVEGDRTVAKGKEVVDFRKRSMLIGPYISWDQFNRDIIDFSDSIKGKGYDAVIGIPRSGLAVASQMSIRLGLPLYSLGEYGPIYLAGGLRVRRRGEEIEPKKALLVEDSTASGHSFAEAEKWMGELMTKWGVGRAAIYTVPGQIEYLAEYHRELDLPHWFEWNLLWNKWIMDQWKVGVDFDGILCPDFTPEQDDDGWRYLDAMKNARCLVPQGTHIYAIITARLNKYRPWTEDWLRDHGITYDHLIMAPWEDPHERSMNCIGSYKAEHCESLGVGMFVESCPVQSQIIRDKRYQPVLCPALGGSIAK